MLERYSLTATSIQLSERFSVDIPESYKPRYNVLPSQLLPVITHESPKGISFFYWGLAPGWAKNKSISEKIINARAEQINERPVLKKNLMQHRCIIPVDGFYGWKKIGKKSTVPYRFVLHTKELFSLAGLWEEYDDENGELYHTFTIITCQANDLVSAVQERMPAILDRPAEKIWLNVQSSAEELLPLLAPYPSSKMDCYTVSPRINSIVNDDATLILPAPPADQFGNLTLFD